MFINPVIIKVNSFGKTRYIPAIFQMDIDLFNPRSHRTDSFFLQNVV